MLRKDVVKVAFSNPFKLSTSQSLIFITYRWTFIDTNNSTRVPVNLTVCLPYLPHHPGVIDGNLPHRKQAGNLFLNMIPEYLFL
jgi:hypothetical protein